MAAFGKGRGITMAAGSFLPRKMSTAPALPSLSSTSGAPLTMEENLALRRRHLAPSQKIHYDGEQGGPLHLSRGEGAYLYDTHGVRHLDCVNNVAHVGHCHPLVVAAATRQLSTLNTNSRYVHDNITRLAAALAATLPAPLSSVFFVNSGTEANDLAMRLVRNHTKRHSIYCVDGAYHGHSIATLSISPYGKYALAESAPGAVKLMQPDVYRLGLTEEETTKRALRQYRDMLDSR
jgi:ethanolamine-phosphate phospho-lyase